MTDIRKDLRPIIDKLSASEDRNDIAMAGLLCASLAAHLCEKAEALFLHQRPWGVAHGAFLDSEAAEAGLEILIREIREVPNA